MIYNREIYAYLSEQLKKDEGYKRLNIKSIGIGPGSILPAPGQDAGGLKELFPLVHLTESPSGSYIDATDEQSQKQNYYIRVKYYTIIQGSSRIINTMTAGLDTLMEALKPHISLGDMNLKNASPLWMWFTGKFMLFDEAESMIAKDTGHYLCCGWFEIKISINYQM